MSFPSQAQCDVKIKSSDLQTFDQAIAEYGQRHYREAGQLMRRVAQRNPKAADPQFWLGMMAVDNGFNATAIRKYITKCINLCEDYPDARAHYYMGMIHYTDERYEEAVAELEKYFRMANDSDRQEWTALYEEASAYLHWSQFLAEAMLHMAPFEPAPLKGVSSAKRNENLPFITHDGSRCYYLREVPASTDRSSFYNKQTEKTRWALHYSEWRDSVFTTGVELPAPFNQGDPEGGVSVTADGMTLFFSRITHEKGYANSDLYCAHYLGGPDPDGHFGSREQWKVERLSGTINGEKSWESQPSVSADGQWLYFASNRKGGQGGTDLWRCHRLKNGDWSRPENLGPSVNTAGNEKSPFLHADGHTLYFVSDGWQGFGGYDVYFIDMAGASYPTNLGLPFNTESDELSFGVTTDGTKAYFPGRMASSRSKDILIFDLYPAARPEPMRCCHLRVSGKNLQRNQTFMLSYNKPTAVTFAEEGMMPVILCRTGKEWKDEWGSYVVLNDSLSPLPLKPLSDSRLSEHDEKLLDAWAAWLLDHPRVHVAIECPKTADAKAVYDYLTIKKKLRTERLTYRGGSAFDKNQIRLQ